MTTADVMQMAHTDVRGEDPQLKHGFPACDGGSENGCQKTSFSGRSSGARRLPVNDVSGRLNRQDNGCEWELKMREAARRA